MTFWPRHRVAPKTGLEVRTLIAGAASLLKSGLFGQRTLEENETGCAEEIKNDAGGVFGIEGPTRSPSSDDL
jgi:hypothetical protein